MFLHRIGSNFVECLSMLLTTAILNGLKIERLFHIFLMSQNSIDKNVHVLKILQTRLFGRPGSFSGQKSGHTTSWWLDELKRNSDLIGTLYFEVLHCLYLRYD